MKPGSDPGVVPAPMLFGIVGEDRGVTVARRQGQSWDLWCPKAPDKCAATM
jgi:hypothetical protein